MIRLSLLVTNSKSSTVISTDMQPLWSFYALGTHLCRSPCTRGWSRADECVDVIKPSGVTSPEVLPEASNGAVMCKGSITAWCETTNLLS